jgi:predicted  nucleic acid-binding Zn-ribbon protein
MARKNEAVESLAEGGFSENEMRTDYARSCVWPGWARLSHDRTPEVHTLEDVLDLQAKIIEAGDRKSANLMREASTALAGAADKILGLEREKHEDGQRMRDLERDLRDARAALEKANAEIKTAEENLQTLRMIVAGGEVL